MFEDGKDRSGKDRSGKDRSGKVLLREWRVWAREQWENECLITDDAPEPVHDAREHMDGLLAALAGTDVATLDDDGLMGTVLALEDRAAAPGCGEGHRAGSSGSLGSHRGSCRSGCQTLESAPYPQQRHDGGS
ncbi:MAG: hypothetical protein M5U19_21040 [Microthrixaceae bacterium]|nr:hypothetical protein [Microthrixaceae bacterium]